MVQKFKPTSVSNEVNGFLLLSFCIHSLLRQTCPLTRSRSTIQLLALMGFCLTCGNTQYPLDDVFV